MDNDFVTEVGVGLLAHRFRRVVDHIMAECRSHLTATGMKVPAKGVSTVLLLAEEGPLGITEISQRLNFSHTLVVRLVTPLAASGLVIEHRDPNDGRRRVLELTAKGKKAAADVRRVFLADVEDAYRELFEEIGVDLFDAVNKLDAALDKKRFAARLADAAANSRKKSA